MINLKIISALNPCKDRLENYIGCYGDKEFTPRQFLGLKHITQADKLWVAFRLMPKANIPLAAADIAESVLSIYENKYPGDLRPRKAIEAARSGAKAAAAAVADADAANTYAYADAAYVAAYAAANAACYTAIYAAYATNASNRGVQEKLNRTIVLRYWR